MGVRCVTIRACGRGKIDTGVPRMAVRVCGAAAAVVALLSAAIALQWSPLLAGTGRVASARRLHVQRREAGGTGLRED